MLCLSSWLAQLLHKHLSTTHMGVSALDITQLEMVSLAQ